MRSRSLLWALSVSRLAVATLRAVPAQPAAHSPTLAHGAATRAACGSDVSHGARRREEQRRAAGAALARDADGRRLLR